MLRYLILFAALILVLGAATTGTAAENYPAATAPADFQPEVTEPEPEPEAPEARPTNRSSGALIGGFIGGIIGGLLVRRRGPASPSTPLPPHRPF